MNAIHTPASGAYVATQALKRERLRVRGSRVAATLVSLIAAACSSRAGDPDAQVNPTPKHRFEIEATLRDAPGEFDSATAQVVYEVQNRKCAPLTAVSGVRATPRHVVEVPVTRNVDRYQATFFSDALLDGDYYGQGLCHWSVNIVSIVFKRDKREFVAAIIPTGPYARSNVTTYFSNDSYENAAKPESDTGLFDRMKFKQPDKTFQIDLTAREANK